MIKKNILKKITLWFILLLIIFAVFSVILTIVKNKQIIAKQNQASLKSQLIELSSKQDELDKFANIIKYQNIELAQLKELVTALELNSNAENFTDIEEVSPPCHNQEIHNQLPINQAEILTKLIITKLQLLRSYILHEEDINSLLADIFNLVPTNSTLKEKFRKLTNLANLPKQADLIELINKLNSEFKTEQDLPNDNFFVDFINNFSADLITVKKVKNLNNNTETTRLNSLKAYILTKDYANASNYINELDFMHPQLTLLKSKLVEITDYLLLTEDLIILLEGNLNDKI